MKNAKWIVVMLLAVVVPVWAATRMSYISMSASNIISSTLNNDTITNSSLDGTPIGQSTAAAGTFTTLLMSTARRGTFICTAGGTRSVANTNVAANSIILFSLNTAGGTISTAPAISVNTPGTGFSALCGASDTSTYNYEILN